MEKHAIVEFIQSKLTSGELTPADLTALIHASPASGFAAPPTTSIRTAHHLNITKTLYYLGGLIILIGIAVFVSQFWRDLGPAGRIAVSLGSAVAAYMIGVYLSKAVAETELAAAFHLIGGTMFPFGLYTILNEMHQPITLGTWVLMFGGLALLYLCTMIIVEYPLITLFAIVNSTVFLFTLANFTLQDATIADWYSYFGIIMGASYLYLGSQFIATRNEPLNKPLFLIGSIWILAASFVLHTETTLWALVYPAVIAAMIGVSLYLKQMSVLFISTFAIMAYITYITGKYFANVVGWPVALIAIGFIFVGIGYATFYMRRTYFA